MKSNNTERRSGRILVLLFGVVLFAFFVYQHNNPEWSCIYASKNMLKLSFDGVITSKFKDESNHLYRVLIVNHNKKYIYLDLYLEAWEYAKIGDTFKKEVNQYKIVITRGNESKNFYPNCYDAIMSN